jgi:hypothetical protein
VLVDVLGRLAGMHPVGLMLSRESSALFLAPLIFSTRCRGVLLLARRGFFEDQIMAAVLVQCWSAVAILLWAACHHLFQHLFSWVQPTPVVFDGDKMWWNRRIGGVLMRPPASMSVEWAISFGLDAKAMAALGYASPR